jgi:hypothetical protein
VTHPAAQQPTPSPQVTRPAAKQPTPSPQVTHPVRTASSGPTPAPQARPRDQAPAPQARPQRLAAGASRRKPKQRNIAAPQVRPHAITSAPNAVAKSDATPPPGNPETRRLSRVVHVVGALRAGEGASQCIIGEAGPRNARFDRGEPPAGVRRSCAPSCSVSNKTIMWEDESCVVRWRLKDMIVMHEARRR